MWRPFCQHLVAVLRAIQRRLELICHRVQKLYLLLSRFHLQAFKLPELSHCSTRYASFEESTPHYGSFTWHEVLWFVLKRWILNLLARFDNVKLSLTRLISDSVRWINRLLSFYRDSVTSLVFKLKWVGVQQGQNRFRFYSFWMLKLSTYQQKEHRCLNHITLSVRCFCFVHFHFCLTVGTAVWHV